MNEPVDVGKGMLTKWRLTELLFRKEKARVRTGDGAEGVLQGISRESGSGSSFILRILGDDGRTFDYYAYARD